MDRLDAMSLFVSAVEGGSLAEAGRRHGRSAATVSRAVALLEAHVGEPLLLRSTRKLKPTPAGVRHMLVWCEVLWMLERRPRQEQDGLRGALVLTAPEMFGRLHVMPVMEGFLGAHRDVSARMLLLDRVVDLVGEGVDVAVRLAPLRSSTLMTIRLGEVRSLICAAPDYLARHGTPDTPRALERHDCIGQNGDGDGALWSFNTGTARKPLVRAQHVRTRLAVNTASAAIEAALRGRGIVNARSYQVAEHLESGRLVRLLRDQEPGPIPAQLVFPSDRARPGLTRRFIEHAVPVLKETLGEMQRAIDG